MHLPKKKQAKIDRQKAERGPQRRVSAPVRPITIPVISAIADGMSTVRPITIPAISAIADGMSTARACTCRYSF